MMRVLMRVLACLKQSDPRVPQTEEDQRLSWRGTPLADGKRPSPADSLFDSLPPGALRSAALSTPRERSDQSKA
jgi:hypothetical protein